MLSESEHHRRNAAIFTDPKMRLVGRESPREARARFSRAITAALYGPSGETCEAITHGTVMSLFVGAHNDVDAFALWKQLRCPSFVVLQPGMLALVEVVPDAV
jgi:broad specificity phosphatase PhoE